MKKTEWVDGIEVKASKIDGRGTYATKPFKKGRKIAEFVGERIARVETARRLRNARRIHICGIDSYWAIDGSVGGNGTQFINHCCDPNCSMRLGSRGCTSLCARAAAGNASRTSASAGRRTGRRVWIIGR